MQCPYLQIVSMYEQHVLGKGCCSVVVQVRVPNGRMTSHYKIANVMKLTGRYNSLRL